MADISVSQSEANELFEQSLSQGEQKAYKDLVDILKENFKSINNSQCSGLIHRAHKNQDGVLEKNGKMYALRSPKAELKGITKVKEKIQRTLDDIAAIPNSEFSTTDEFTKLVEIKQRLELIIKD
jgi:flagellar hook-basal body complex protein FliE